ncbi:MAG: TIGR03768 family metallophosphoesterase [Betaproteobacteria bacterium]
MKNENIKKAEEANDNPYTRRDFLKLSAMTFGAMTISSVTYGAINPARKRSVIQKYPISLNVTTTLQAMLSFPKTLPGLTPPQICEVEKYSSFGYGNWTVGSPLPLMPRTDIMPANYSNTSPARKTKFANFFTFSDIHITDKEAPNQLIHFQQAERFAYNNTSIYSPVMMYTTHVLDAAVQTVNALHKKNRFDFGLSLGDTCNSTSYNELRWYIDVIDGKVITPSSGAHLGADSIDYQKPYQAAGLDKSIPWYQTMGNHDHFYIGSFPVDANPALGFRQSYIADSVWSMANILAPNLRTFPVLFDITGMTAKPQYYAGVIDGSNPYGKIIHAGLASEPAFAAGAPKIAADPDRRSLVRTEWRQEFFKTTTKPVGHGFNLVDKNSPPGFTCYSFVPNPEVPLKVIVLDNTQREDDGSTDIHGHGYLDADRWAWLQAELAKGQMANQLMVIAAHVPIAVAPVGSEMEWWGETTNIAPQHRNAVSLAELVKTLQNTPNFLMWMAGHRHLNTVKAFPSTDPGKPEQGFWQVETSSLRDFPQQFRTFEIYLNSDFTVSIVTVNVDPAVAEGTPAATSRKYAIAVQQIVQNSVSQNYPNNLTAGGTGKLPVPSMDPTRPQSDDPKATDPTIKYVDLSNAPVPVPLHGSYNTELFVQLSPQMVSVLKEKFR